MRLDKLVNYSKNYWLIGTKVESGPIVQHFIKGITLFGFWSKMKNKTKPNYDHTFCSKSL